MGQGSIQRTDPTRRLLLKLVSPQMLGDIVYSFMSCCEASDNSMAGSMSLAVVALLLPG